MAKGREEHEARQWALQSFGKDLARRAKSKCELCEVAGEKLAIFEVPPVPSEPDFDHCLLVCERCRSALEGSGAVVGGEEWRVLAQTVWSEMPAAQVAAVLLLKRLAATEDWARETVEELYLDDEVADWVTRAG